MRTRSLCWMTGRCRGIGTHEELMAGNEIYQEIYDSQKEGADL